MLRSKAEYGNAIDTDLSLLDAGRSGERLKVIVGLSFESVSCCDEFRVYRSEVEFQVKPKAFSKASHTDCGSHKCGMVESIMANMPSLSSSDSEDDDVVLLVVMEEMPTRRSLDMSV